MKPLPALATDPSLPSFQHPTYLDAADELQLVWDVWQELKDCNMSAKTHPFLSLLGSKDPSSSVID